VTEIDRLEACDAKTKGANALKMLCGPMTFPFMFSSRSEDLTSKIDPNPSITPAFMYKLSKVLVCSETLAAAS